MIDHFERTHIERGVAWRCVFLAQLGPLAHSAEVRDADGVCWANEWINCRRKDMAMLDALIDDMTQRFGLGRRRPRRLVREALVLIIGSQGGNQRLSEHPQIGWPRVRSRIVAWACGRDPVDRA